MNSTIWRKFCTSKRCGKYSKGSRERAQHAEFSKHSVQTQNIWYNFADQSTVASEASTLLKEAVCGDNSASTSQAQVDYTGIEKTSMLSGRQNVKEPSINDDHKGRGKSSKVISVEDRILLLEQCKLILYGNKKRDWRKRIKATLGKTDVGIRILQWYK